MAFDVQGFTKAAKEAGFSQDEINKTISQRTGARGWLTNGKTGGAGVLNAAGNILNLPSYAIGGFLNKGQQLFGSKYGQGDYEKGMGIFEGIKNKRAVMSELPETIGVDPNSTIGKVIGFGGELLTPDPISIIGDIGKTSGLFAKSGDAGLFARAGNKASTKLADMSDDVITKGLGQPQTLKKVGQITKEKPGAFIKRLGIESRDPAAARALKSDLIKQFNEIGLSTKTKAAVAPTIKAFDDEIIKMMDLAKSGSETAAKTAEELAKRKAGFLAQVKNADDLGVDVFTQLKRAAASDVPQTKIGLGMSGSAKADAAEFARKQFQQGAIRGDSRLARLGTDIRGLGGSPGSKGMIDVFEGAVSRNVARSPFNFGKMVSGGIGAQIAGFPGAVGGAVVETIARSPQFAKATSDVLETGSKFAPRAGQMLQKASPYLGKAATTGFRVSSQSNPVTSERSMPAQSGQSPRLQGQQPQVKQIPYKPTIAPTRPPVKSNMPTAESFYEEIRKKRGY